MAKIEDWHRKAAYLIVYGECESRYTDKEIYHETIQDDFEKSGDRREVVAKIIASHAPASTAPKEVIEKYARDLRMHNETRPLANTREKQEETLRAILTRFADEIGGVDVEPYLWICEYTEPDSEGMGPTLFKTCADKEDAELCASKLNGQAIPLFAAAIKAAGGKK